MSDAFPEQPGNLNLKAIPDSQLDLERGPSPDTTMIGPLVDPPIDVDSLSPQNYQLVRSGSAIEPDLEKGLPMGDTAEMPTETFSFGLNLLGGVSGRAASTTSDSIRAEGPYLLARDPRKRGHDDPESPNKLDRVRVVDGTKGKLYDAVKQATQLKKRNALLKENLHAQNDACLQLDSALIQQQKAHRDQSVVLAAAQNEVMALKSAVQSADQVEKNYKDQLEEDLKLQTSAFTETVREMESKAAAKQLDLQRQSDVVTEQNIELAKKLKETQDAEERQREELRRVQDQSSDLRERLREMEAAEEKRRLLATKVAERQQAEADKQKEEDRAAEERREAEVEKLREQFEAKAREDKRAYEEKIEELVRSRDQLGGVHKDATGDGDARSVPMQIDDVERSSFSVQNAHRTTVEDEVEVEPDQQLAEVASHHSTTHGDSSDTSKERRFVVPSLNKPSRSSAADTRNSRRVPPTQSAKRPSNSKPPPQSTDATPGDHPRSRPTPPLRPESDTEMRNGDGAVTDANVPVDQADTEEGEGGKSKKPPKDRKARKTHTAFITSVIRKEFNIVSETAFRWHNAATVDEVNEYNESEGEEGIGPQRFDIRFDFSPGSVANFWNYACAELLLDKTTVKYPKKPLEHSEYVEMVIDKLKRLKHHYSDARPKFMNGIQETGEDVLNRFEASDKVKDEHDRANTRMKTKFAMRDKIVTKELDLCSPDSVERKYWIFLRDMLDKLQVQGMSSDETDFDEVTKEKVFRVNVLLWRKDISENLAFIDEKRDDDLHFSTRGSRGFKKIANRKFYSRRAAVKGLPRAFYDDSWFKKIDERRRSLTLKVSRKDFKWLDEQEMRDFRSSHAKRTT
ncbi:hypothetical protein SCHPADRAFT_946790 [Schizopora paradoxa]|uniref:Uncharacterized protein n=1 Tax=Schizopora paradoxa TaxID=27342 RepID=A0A0H2R7V5_9AGAM|nr:hypothetical protein SCHPADRAFT_946790 [Schizopora paradoxa]